MKAEDSAKSDHSVTYTLIFKVKFHDERNDHMPLQLIHQLYGQPLPITWLVGIYMHKHNNDATEAQHTLSLSHICLCHKTMTIINFLKPLQKFLMIYCNKLEQHSGHCPSCKFIKNVFLRLDLSPSSCGEEGKRYFLLSPLQTVDVYHWTTSSTA
jgi:hypothetical protein